MLGVRRIAFRPLTSCWSSSKFLLRQSWSRGGRPPAFFFDPNTANQQQQQQQQFLLCHTNDVRWLATKRQKRTAAASSSSSSTSGHVSAAAVRSTNTENQPASGGDSTLSANTAAAVNRLPRADDDDNDIKTTTTTTTTTKNESDGRVFQSHDQIFAKRNANRAAGPSPAVLWLPPPPLGTGTSEAQAASSNQLLFSSNNLLNFMITINNCIPRICTWPVPRRIGPRVDTKRPRHCGTTWPHSLVCRVDPFRSRIICDSV
jgi:hypothetical protein